jgi:hypothetical protein
MPNTESVEALDVVEAVDIEPDIVGEASDPGFGEVSDPGEEILEVEEIAEDADSAEIIEATEVVKDDPGDKKR